MIAEPTVTESLLRGLTNRSDLTNFLQKHIINKKEKC